MIRKSDQSGADRLTPVEADAEGERDDGERGQREGGGGGDAQVRRKSITRTVAPRATTKTKRRAGHEQEDDVGERTGTTSDKKSKTCVMMNWSLLITLRGQRERGKNNSRSED